MRPVLILGRFVILEARRTGLPTLFACIAVTGFGLAGFLSQLALTESSALQASVLGAFYRLSSVFLISAFVISSMVRESNDKGLELLLSLPISRAQYFLGKLAGFIVCGAAMAGGLALLLLFWSPPLSVAAWFVSLSMELALMASVSLFFVLTLTQVVPALAASTCLYILARIVASVQAISSGPLSGEESLLQRLPAWGIDAVAFLLPPLESATQTSWLTYGGPSPGELLGVLGSLAIYGALVSAAGLFDLYRRNL